MDVAQSSCNDPSSLRDLTKFSAESQRTESHKVMERVRAFGILLNAREWGSAELCKQIDDRLATEASADPACAAYLSEIFLDPARTRSDRNTAGKALARAGFFTPEIKGVCLDCLAQDRAGEEFRNRAEVIQDAVLAIAAAHPNDPELRRGILQSFRSEILHSVPQGLVGDYALKCVEALKTHWSADLEVLQAFLDALQPEHKISKEFFAFSHKLGEALKEAAESEACRPLLIAALRCSTSHHLLRAVTDACMPFLKESPELQKEFIAMLANNEQLPYAWSGVRMHCTANPAAQAAALQMVDDPECATQRRYEAFELLEVGARNDPSIAAKLFQWTSDVSFDWSETAAYSLGKASLESREIIRQIREEWDALSPEARRQIIQGYRSATPEQAGEVLVDVISCLNDPDREIRGAALTTLCSYADKRSDARAALIGALPDLPADRLKLAGGALARCMNIDPSVRHLLLALLKDESARMENWTARYAALYAFHSKGCFDTPIIEQALRSLDKAEAAWVRTAAACILSGEVGKDPRVTRAMLEALTDNYYEVKLVATTAFVTATLEGRCNLIDELLGKVENRR